MGGNYERYWVDFDMIIIIEIRIVNIIKYCVKMYVDGFIIMILFGRLDFIFSLF